MARRFLIFWLASATLAGGSAWPRALRSEIPLTPAEELPPEDFAQLRTVDLDAFRRYRALVDPLGQLDPYIRSSAQGIEIRQGKDAPWIPLAPVAVPTAARELELYSFDAATRLDGLRIAIDPGHRGGAWSKTEGRHIRVGPGAPVREGDLSWSTAVQLAEMLRARGAQVRLTRSAPPRRDFPRGRFRGYAPKLEASQWALELSKSPRFAPASQWLNTPLGKLAAPFFVASLPRWAPFKLYNRYELRERSRRAESFSPHVTLSLHYNVSRDPLTNGVIVFVLGNFVANELATASQRYYALRALSSGVLAKARPLAISLGRAMQEELQLEPLSEPSQHPPGIAKKLPLAPEDGVFARNLALLRRTAGLVLLLEGPCMNAVGEFDRLQRRDVRLADGSWTSSRTTAYARAVVRALATHRDALLESERLATSPR
ncbi:MAG: hypothetical protein AAFQ82_02275 [Myxococcota bacterium]